MAVFTETIQLKDEVSAAAEKAQKEVKILSKALDSVSVGLVKAAALGDVKSFQSLTKKSEALKSTLSTLPPVMDESGAAAGGMLEELTAVTGGLAAVAAAALAVVGAVGFVVFKLAAFAVESTEAKTASLSLWSALGQGKVTGEEIDGMLDGLRSKLGISKEDLGKFTTEFLKMGVTGKAALETLTTAAVSAEAIVKGGGDAFVKIQRQIDGASAAGQKLAIPFKKLNTQLQAMGLTVDDVAKGMGISGKALAAQLKAGTVDAGKFGDALSDAAIKKGAGPLETLANSTANLGKLFKEYLGDIFEDMGKQIAPLMKEVKSLFETFSQAQPSGQAIKAGLVAGLTKVFEVATMLVPIVKHFFLDLIIYALKAYIVLKPIVQTIRDFAASAEGSAVLTEIFNGLIYAAEVMGVALLVVVAVVGVLAAVLIGMQVAIVAVGGIILGFVADAGAALTGWAGSAVTAAYNFIAGLVSGIAGGASQVIAAVTGVADGAVDAFKKKLGIASPSKVMMQLGDHTGTGFAMGLEDAGPDVHAAASGVASSAVAGASSSGDASAAGKSNAGNTWNINVQIDGAGKDAASITREMVSSVFESMALTAGV